VRNRTATSSTSVKSRPTKRAATAIPGDLQFEDSTLRAAAFVLFRRLIGSGLTPEAAATLLTERLHGQLLLELQTDLECLREGAGNLQGQ
jgi:hypothetical protein